MRPPETELTAALDANVALRVQAERLIAAYVAPESDRPAIINELIALFDGPAQREAQRLSVEALGRAPTKRLGAMRGPAESYRDVIIRIARGLVRLAEPLLIMAALLQLRSSRRKSHAVALSPIKRHSALQRPL
jgi:hypothetical protein